MLTYKQKTELRRSYGRYKTIPTERNEFDSRQEYMAEQKRCYDDFEAMAIEAGLTEAEINNIEEILYSANQLLFIEDAEQTNFELHWDYSGRGMFGDCCPALYCDNHNDLKTQANTKIDSMGMGIVIYAQS